MRRARTADRHYAKHPISRRRHTARQETHSYAGSGIVTRDHGRRYRMALRIADLNLGNPRRELDGRFGHVRPLPTERIEHDNGHSRAARIDARNMRFQGVLKDRFGSELDELYAFRFVYVDDMNAGAGHQIVKLIKQYATPAVQELVLRILPPSQHRQR